jgi:hypothetical protein
MPLPIGANKAKVLKTYFTTSQAGNAGLSIKVEVGDAWEKEEMTGTIWFSPKAAGMARRQLKVFGFDIDTTDLSEIGQSVDFVGMEILVTLKEEDYHGVLSLKIDCFGAVKAPTADELGAAQRALRAAKGKTKEKAPPGDKAPPAAKQEPQTRPTLPPDMQTDIDKANRAIDDAQRQPGDDDVPFDVP